MATLSAMVSHTRSIGAFINAMSNDSLVKIVQHNIQRELGHEAMTICRAVKGVKARVAYRPDSMKYKMEFQVTWKLPDGFSVDKEYWCELDDTALADSTDTIDSSAVLMFRMLRIPQDDLLAMAAFL